MNEKPMESFKKWLEGELRYYQAEVERDWKKNHDVHADVKLALVRSILQEFLTDYRKLEMEI